jgi:hypothetical protein
MQIRQHTTSSSGSQIGQPLPLADRAVDTADSQMLPGSGTAITVIEWRIQHMSPDPGAQAVFVTQ